MKRAMTGVSAIVALMLAASSPALATSVTLAPNVLDVAQGSTVNVSVNMSVSSPITLAALSTNIWYDKDVFTYEDASVVVKGDLLTHDWWLSGSEYAEGKLRVGGIDLNLAPWCENLAAGASGTLFTFTLKVKEGAPTGLSALAWGVYDGQDNATAGFDYGDASGQDVILSESEMAGASINITPIPEPLTMLGLGMGVAGLGAYVRKRRATPNRAAHCPSFGN